MLFFREKGALILKKTDLVKNKLNDAPKYSHLNKVFYAGIAMFSGTLGTGISAYAHEEGTDALPVQGKESDTSTILATQDTATIPVNSEVSSVEVTQPISESMTVTSLTSESTTVLESSLSESTSTTSQSAIQDSQSQMSQSTSQSTTSQPSESTSTSQTSQSTSQTSEQASTSTSTLYSTSTSTSTSTSLSMSTSLSTSTSTSHSTSIKHSTSTSTSASLSNSSSMKRSQSTSLSQAHAVSLSTSTSMSLSTKTPPRPTIVKPVEQVRPTTPTYTYQTPSVAVNPSYTSSSTIDSTFNLDHVLNNMTQKQFKLSDSVLQWKDLVTKVAKEQGMEQYVPLILAIIQVESNGTGTKDIMQSSESAGHGVNYFQTEEASVQQGVKHLRNVVEKAASYNKGYEKNIKLIAQAYNYGPGFIDYVHTHGGYYNLSVAQKYSKDVVAPSLGNTTGQTYKYSNFFSQAANNEFLYLNGGNYYYGNIVSSFVYQEFSPILMALDEFQGQEYVFGGKNPAMGFDCSGIVSWGLAKLDISLPSYTVSQWQLTTPVKLEDARPGDLIFFKGTYGDADFISHVEFYVDENTMFGSNGNGVGYHNFKDSYWQQHFAGVRRVTELSQVFDAKEHLNLNR